jgi:hypothetical protein
VEVERDVVAVTVEVVVVMRRRAVASCLLPPPPPPRARVGDDAPPCAGRNGWVPQVRRCGLYSWHSRRGIGRSWPVSFLGRSKTNNIFSRVDFNPIEKTKQLEWAVPDLIPRQPNEAKIIKIKTKILRQHQWL